MFDGFFLGPSTRAVSPIAEWLGGFLVTCSWRSGAIAERDVTKKRGAGFQKAAQYPEQSNQPDVPEYLFVENTDTFKARQGSAHAPEDVLWGQANRQSLDYPDFGKTSPQASYFVFGLCLFTRSLSVFFSLPGAFGFLFEHLKAAGILSKGSRLSVSGGDAEPVGGAGLLRLGSK